MLSALPIPLPSLSEQAAIVSEIEQRLTVIEEVDKEIQINMGLRVIEWVHLYLLEHASKDFQTKIFLIS